MGKRARRRGREERAPKSTTDYRDPEGNVLTLRDAVSPGTAAKLRETSGGAAATADDLWHRHGEMLFERLAVRWEIAGLPLTKQAELLARLRMADSETQRWVRQTIDEHLRRVQPELIE
jgi:phytoene dehydrogenase-like protein